MIKYHFNRERLLLTLLVALAFFGFLLWSIEKSSQEEIILLSTESRNNSQAENKIIKVISPKVNETIKSPVSISGQTLHAKGTLQIRIKDASGLILVKKQISVKENSLFSSSLVYKKPTQTKGVIEIIIDTPKSIRGINILTIPVTFKD